MAHHDNSLTHRFEHRHERGQAAIEFMFVLLIIIALVTLIMQALHFENDVFIKSNRARYEAFKQRRQGDESTRRPDAFSVVITGTQLRKMSWFKVLYQKSSEVGSLNYQRRFYLTRGSKYLDPVGTAFTAGLGLMLLADHYQPTSGKITAYLNILKGALKAWNFVD